MVRKSLDARQDRCGALAIPMPHDAHWNVPTNDTALVIFQTNNSVRQCILQWLAETVVKKEEPVVNNEGKKDHPAVVVYKQRIQLIWQMKKPDVAQVGRTFKDEYTGEILKPESHNPLWNEIMRAPIRTIFIVMITSRGVVKHSVSIVLRKTARAGIDGCTAFYFDPNGTPASDGLVGRETPPDSSWRPQFSRLVQKFIETRKRGINFVHFATPSINNIGNSYDYIKGRMETMHIKPPETNDGYCSIFSIIAMIDAICVGVDVLELKGHFNRLFLTHLLRRGTRAHGSLQNRERLELLLYSSAVAQHLLMICETQVKSAIRDMKEDQRERIREFYRKTPPTVRIERTTKGNGRSFQAVAPL